MRMSNDLRLFAPLRKVTSNDDGTLKISGVASSENVDRTGETITAKAIREAIPDFLSFGTGALREMHQLIAAGTVDEVEVGDDGLTTVVATVVDEAAVKKILAGVYKGLSVGGKTLARDPKNRTIITKIRWDELSLVDRPANGDAIFTIVKAVGTPSRNAMISEVLASMSDEDRLLTLTKAALRFPKSVWTGYAE
jgi:hypothetical protein